MKKLNIVTLGFLLILSSHLLAEDSRIENHETVTSGTDSSDDGNTWGPNIPRIVRTEDGIFTVVMIPGGGQTSKRWSLLKRYSSGWHVLTTQQGGREPVALTAGPDGTLYISGQKRGRTTLWSGRPYGNTLNLSEVSKSSIPYAHWAYNAGGIGPEGGLCVLSSQGNHTGTFEWTYEKGSVNFTRAARTSYRHRYAYAYVFPHSRRGLTVVANRDVMWRVLGHYNTPSSFGEFAFNAAGMWTSTDLGSRELQKVFFREEPVNGFDYAPGYYVSDAYLDREMRMHLLVQRAGPQWQGMQKMFHLMMDIRGNMIFEHELPFMPSYYGRIFETKTKGFFVLGRNGQIFSLGKDGKQVGRVQQLPVEVKDSYATFFLAVPRGGNSVEDFMDIVYSDENKTKWKYFRLYPNP